MMELSARVSALLPCVTAHRRALHQIPEEGHQEHMTQAYLLEALRALSPDEVSPCGGTGVRAVFRGNGKGRAVAFRADMDALHIKEETGRAFSSRNAGMMHACGHDGHMAMQLVAAKLLNRWKDQWDGTVLFMFERGEEASGPLEYLLRYLEQDSPWHVDACYATHVRWDIPAGKIAICDEAPMAGGFGFEIRIDGHGGHGSRPDLAQSPIDCFHDFYGNLQALRMRIVPPKECLTYSIGSLHSGDTLNVIPNSLTFSGTSRFFSYDNAGKGFYEVFQDILKNSCQTYGCSYEILHMPDPLFEVQNDPTCVGIAREAVKKYLGPDVLTDCQPWMASETFALTARLYPGVLIFTGIENKEKGCGANHHTPEFDLDEDGLPYGAATCLGFALDYLKEKPDIPFKRPDEPLEKLVARNI